MADLVTQAVLASVTAKPYDFMDESNRQVTGTTRTITTVGEFDESVQEIKLKRDDELVYLKACDLDQFDVVDLHWRFVPRKGGVELRLVDITKTAAA